MLSTHLIFWLSFIVLYIIVFSIDMYAAGHQKGTMSVKTALKWTGLWISLAILYGLAILFFFPQNADSDPSISTRTVMFSKFIAGYFTEYSLSVDNLFVFIMIFSLMGVSEKNQPRLLKLGILLSIVLRILFILVGMSLVQKFSWIIYIFGAILLWTAYKMAFTNDEDQVDPQNNFLYKTGSKLFQSIRPRSSAFLLKIDGSAILLCSCWCFWSSVQPTCYLLLTHTGNHWCYSRWSQWNTHSRRRKLHCHYLECIRGYGACIAILCTKRYHGTFPLPETRRKFYFAFYCPENALFMVRTCRRTFQEPLMDFIGGDYWNPLSLYFIVDCHQRKRCD